jgi:hypothetical protein
MVDGFTNPSGALPHAPVGGRRRKTGKKLRLVKKTTVRKVLAKHGFRMRGGADSAGVPAGKDVAETGDLVKAEPDAAMGGRRRRSRKGRKSSRRSRKVFGLF